MIPSDDVELVLSRDDDAHIVKNLWPLYQHDVSRFDGAVPIAMVSLASTTT